MTGPLRLCHLPIDTNREPVVYLPRHSTACRPEDFQALAKIELRGGGRHILATLNIIDHEDLLALSEVGVSDQAFALLGLPEGAAIEIEQAAPPASLEAVHAKIRGAELSAAAIDLVVQDIAAMHYSRMEIAAFLVACAGFLSTSEVLHLTHAMAKVGSRLRWPGEVIVDKHCIGGVPGNRTSMIVVPIVAAHGLAIPKTSSRAITSPAGTADTMEVLARVDLDIDEMREVVAAESGCLVWGGHVNLSPADDILISVERPLDLDAPGQLVASILSKKLAAGVTRLVLDIPLGPSAKVRDSAGALQLRKLFEYVASQIGLVLDVVITDGTQPVGRGVGPALEARDVMQVLRGDRAAPADLRARALSIAAHVLELDPALRGGSGLERARELLESGAALRKMERILLAQGAAPGGTELGALTHDVVAEADGKVAAIDCYRIARLARAAGAPTDKGAGIDLLKKVGESVREGEPLYRIHACLDANFRIAREAAAADRGYELRPTGA
jgi:thymidine phosphorylase